jgi:hypothetical protein
MNYDATGWQKELGFDAYNAHASQAVIDDVRATLEPLLEAHAPECQGILNDIAIVAADCKVRLEKGCTPAFVRKVSARVSATEQLDEARRKIFELTEILENLNPYHLQWLEDNLGEPYAFSHLHRVQKPPGIVASLERLDLALRDTANRAKTFPSGGRKFNPEMPFIKDMWRLLNEHGVKQASAAKFIADAAVALKIARDKPGLEQSIRVRIAKKTAAPSPQR